MKTRALRQSPRAVLAVLLLLAGAACSEDPGAAPRQYALSAETVEALADNPEAQARILGTLEMLFGTPQQPSYMVTAEWLDEGYDPNWPWYAADDGGSGEFGEERAEELIAGNRRRFAKELALVDEERYEELGGLRGAPRLEESWGLLLGERDEYDDFQEEARLTFEEHYPSLRDSADLYRLECMHCHGNEGGGDGPTAPFLNPLPRDYRRGIFKFTAVKDKARPRRADLYRIIDEGATGTAMPSFRRFSPAQIEGLVDYVRLLAIRGEVERLLTLAVLDEELITPSLVEETYVDVWSKWQEADDFYFAFDGEIPAVTDELIERGRVLYNDATTGNCASCHDERGTGLGASAFLLAEDGGFALDENGERVSAYQDDWGHPIVPRNLTYGVFRGGKRPIDIYRRIYAGINGTPMPAMGDSKNPDGTPMFSDEDMWALVHYVRSLAERRDQIGLEVHPLVSGGAAGSHDDGHGGGHDDAHDDAHDDHSGEHGR